MSDILRYDPQSEVIPLDPSTVPDIEKEDSITGVESDFLNELIKDCIYYGLKASQCHQYIMMRFGKDISNNVLRTRKWRLSHDDNAQIWLSHFTRVGFVMKHKKLIELTERLVDTISHDIFFESMKPYAPTEARPNMQPHELRNDFKLLRMRSDMRESIKLMKDIMVESPMVSEIMGHIDAEFKIKVKLLEVYGIDIDQADAHIQGLQVENKGKDTQGRTDQEDNPEAVF